MITSNWNYMFPRPYNHDGVTDSTFTSTKKPVQQQMTKNIKSSDHHDPVWLEFNIIILPVQNSYFTGEVCVLYGIA